MFNIDFRFDVSSLVAVASMIRDVLNQVLTLVLGEFYEKYS
jgi:hypothetical protein